MKKSLFLPSLICLSVNVLAQQTPFKGVVSIHNGAFDSKDKKVQYVAFAQVEEDFDRAQAALTDQDGKFTLQLIGIPTQERFTYQVKKEGLEVVNIDQLEAVAGQRELVKISMAKPQYVADFRKNIYKVGKTSAEKALTEKINKTQADLAAAKSSAQQNQQRVWQLEAEIAKLWEERENVDATARQLADKYARVNLDNTTPLYQEAFRLFQEGDLQGALRKLQQAQLGAQANNIFRERETVAAMQREAAQRDSVQKRRTGELTEALRLQADLYRATFKWDSVRWTYEVILSLDSTNLDNLWEMAGFLESQNDFQPALRFCRKALSLAKTDRDQAAALYRMATLYRLTGAYAESEKASRESLQFCRKLAAQQPDVHSVNLAKVLNGLGILLGETGAFQASEKCHREALQIYQTLALTDPDDMQPRLATSLSNLAAALKAVQSLDEANQAYRESLKIRRSLAQKDPAEYLPDLTIGLNSLGVFLWETQAFEESEKVYREALDIRKSLAEKNPDAYLPYVASTLSSIGVLLQDVQSYREAEKVYREALKIRRALAEKNPDAYLPKVALTLSNLGTLLKKSESFSEAETAHREALKIRRALVEKYPDAYLPELVISLGNLGNLLKANEANDEAEQLHLEAVKISRKLAEKQPDAYLTSLATSLNNLGTFQVGINDKAAKQNLGEALKIRRSLAEKHPDTQLPDIAGVLSNLGFLAKNNGDFTECEKYYLEALVILRQVAKGSPKAFNHQLANVAVNLGFLYRDWLLKTPDLSYRKKGLEVLNEAEKSLAIYAEESPIAARLRYNVGYLRDEFDHAADEIIGEDARFEKFERLLSQNNSLSNPAEKVERQREMLRLLEELLRDVPGDKGLTSSLALEQGNLAWYLLFAKQFQQAEAAARKGLATDPAEEWIHTNVAHALLFQGKWEQAKAVYERWKGKPYDENMGFTQVFLEDLDTLEKAGVTHPDVAKARKLLEK